MPSTQYQRRFSVHRNKLATLVAIMSLPLMASPSLAADGYRHAKMRHELRRHSDGSIYLIVSAKPKPVARHVASWDDFIQSGVWTDAVLPIDQQELGEFEKGPKYSSMPLPEGTFVKLADDPTVWVVHNGTACFVSGTTFEKAKVDQDAVYTISRVVLNRFPGGEEITTGEIADIGSAGVPPAPTEPIKSARSGEVGRKKSMASNATLYRNGKLVVETSSRSQHITEGLKGRVFVVCVDGNGNAIWVSQVFTCKQCGSTSDGLTPSQRTESFLAEFPEVIGRHTSSLDIFHDSGDVKDARDRWVENIKKGTDVAKEIRDAWNALE